MGMSAVNGNIFATCKIAQWAKPRAYRQLHQGGQECMFPLTANVSIYRLMLQLTANVPINR